MPIGEVAPADTYALDELLQQHQNEQAEASMRVPGQSTGLKHTSDPDSDDPTVKRMREERQAQEQYDVRIWTPFKMYEDEHLEQMEAIKAEEILKRAKVRAMDPKQKAEMRFHHDQLARTLQVAKIDASSTALGIGASSGAGTGSGV